MQPHKNSIAILLCTYNGSHFIKEQLDSFTAQDNSNWKLFVYDDASTDNTPQIVSQYKLTVSQEVFLEINKHSKGFCKNFLSAICTTPNDSADFFALSDQDDIWQNNKLSKAIAYLSTIPSNTPTLYCTRTKIIGDNGQFLGYSALFKKKPSFNNALVQNIAGGNTIVFNKATKALIAATGGANVDVMSHDWWLYLLVTGAGGHVFYDPTPMVLYRQHDGNLIGANHRFGAKLVRLKKILRGQFKQWNKKNVIALNTHQSVLKPENIKTLEKFTQIRKASLLKRLRNFYQTGIYRQTFFDNIALFILIVLKRV